MGLGLAASVAFARIDEDVGHLRLLSFAVAGRKVIFLLGYDK
jgi:hypothetical protein